MLSLELKQKIDQLRSKYKSVDSPAFIDAIEKDLITLFKQKDQLQNPIFKQFVEKAEKSVNEMTALLQSDEKMWSDEGKQIAREREIYRSILNAFGVEYVDKAINDLSYQIDQKLKE